MTSCKMALCVILIASVLGMVCAMPGGNALNITSQSCTLHLGGGLDKIAGHTDLTLSHDCNGGYAHTVVIGGELVDFYRRSGPQCLFPGDGGDTWCVTMQDQGGWHIAAFFQHGPLSGRVDCHPSSYVQLGCQMGLTVGGSGLTSTYSLQANDE